jgi:hypothetical protein
MQTIIASLTNLTLLLPQSRDCSCYVSRPILAPPPRWLLKHIDLRPRDLAHSHELWHQPRLANVTCALSWRLCGLTLSMVVFVDFTLITACCDLHGHTTWPGTVYFDDGAVLRARKEVPWKLLDLTFHCTLPYYPPLFIILGLLPRNFQSERTCWSWQCVCGCISFLIPGTFSTRLLVERLREVHPPFSFVCAQLTG